MFEQGVDKGTKGNLALLSRVPQIKDFYLAGGTATALQLGHRLSYDLDFFSPKNFNSKKISQELTRLGKLKIEQLSADTFLGDLNGRKISFFRYPYQLIASNKKYLEINVADLKDIAAMKLDAIGSRGKKRDFIDLYFIAHEVLPLEKLLEIFEKKFANLAVSRFHILKSLSYFTDAEADPMPEMIKPIDWNEVKRFFEAEVKKLV